MCKDYDPGLVCCVDLRLSPLFLKAHTNEERRGWQGATKHYFEDSWKWKVSLDSKIKILRIVLLLIKKTIQNKIGWSWVGKVAKKCHV